MNLPEDYLRILEHFVAQGKFPNRSEAIRMAIRDLIKTEYLIEDSVKNNKKLNELNNQAGNEYQENVIY